MKQKLLSFWLTALMMLVGQSIFAYSFESDGIYYQIDCMRSKNTAM